MLFYNALLQRGGRYARRLKSGEVPAACRGGDIFRFDIFWTEQ